MMTASPNDVCLTAHDGKHRIIATIGSNIIMRSITSYRRRRCIIFNLQGYTSIHLQKCDIVIPDSRDKLKKEEIIFDYHSLMYDYNEIHVIK